MRNCVGDESASGQCVGEGKRYILSEIHGEGDRNRLKVLGYFLFSKRIFIK